MEPVRLIFRNKVAVFVTIAGAVVILILASLSGRPSRQPLPIGEQSKVIARQEVIIALDSAVDCYQRTGKLPANARELREAILEMHPPKEQISEWIGANSREVVDPWGTPLSIQTSSQSLIVMSAGPDKTFGTNDDIIEKHSLLP